MPKLPITRERQVWITYLMDRAYPCRTQGKYKGERQLGHREFFDELCEQPNNVLLTLYESAKNKHREDQEDRAVQKYGSL